ncbi:MAG: hypothetical protein IRZ10_02670 [Thermoflavifilum sp.]|nr:hypothetical protein [Thermoflavifilum sp.]MCL6513298.1 hypothetical protein [Alicyclobacillus sp.]
MSRFTGTFLLCAVLIIGGLILLIVGKNFVQFLGLVAFILAVLIAGGVEISEKYNASSGA